MTRFLLRFSRPPLLFGLALLACAPQGGSAGTSGTGGATGAGGSAAGGAPGSGGSVPASGGTTASGGRSSGGTLGTGGVSSGAGGDSVGGGPSGGGGSGGVAVDVPITLWLAGDSTVANGNTPCPVGWGKHFDGEFNDLVTVGNSAVGGRSVRTWLYSVTNTMGPDGECAVDTDQNGDPILQTRWTDMVAGMSVGDYLFIQFGINDGSASCDRHVGLTKFKEEYAMMANVARDHGVNPVFVTPVSAISCNGGTAVGSRGAYVTATLEAGEESDVPVIDLHQLSVDRYQELGFCPIPGGDVSDATTGAVGDFFCDDHTHFSDAGSIDIGALMTQGISDLGLPLAGYLQ